MKKNGYLRRFLALFLALVMIMADSSVTTFAATVGRVRKQNATQKVTPTPGNSNTYRDVLGGAVNYGIVTTRLILGGHIDTNFAAGSLEPDTFADAITTGKYTGENNPGNIIIGDIPNHKYGFWAYSSTQKPFIITTTAEALQYIKKERDYVIYDVDHTKEELQRRVEKLRTGTMSTALADESRYTYYTLSSLLNGDQLDLRSYADGTYYIKVDNSAILSQAEGLKIQLNDKQNIVFYVPDNDVAINKFKINEMFSDRNDLSADPYAKRIIWNIPNATHVKIDNTFGVFLCPNADVDLGGTSSGWVVSKSFHNGGEWHNVWSEQPESIITKTNFCVEKKLAGANIANYAGKFNFVLTDEAGKEIQTKSNDGNGNVVFDDIQFDTAGTYTYYITEKNEQLANIGYDTGKVKVTVVVKTYTNQGNRKVTTIESVVYEKLDKDNNKIEESNVFKNSYNEAASGSLSLEGSKLLTGAALTDGMFEFQLSGDAERTVKNAGTKVDFGTIASWTGTDAKEFTFEVSEVNDGKAGYTYDGKTYKVKVKATYSAETNTYSYTLEKGTTEGVTISGGKISLPDKSFQNSFKAASGSLSLEGSKSLTGTELKDNMFEFRLSGDAEKTVKNAGTKVDFGTIASWTGTDAKEFTFEVSEVNDGKAGYTYDGKTYKVKVKATYSAETNTYSYTLEKGTTEGVTISGGKISLPDKSFQNSFEAASGSLSLEGSKSLTGTELKDNMFEFRLSGDAEKTVKNAGTKVDFGTIASWTGTDAKEFTFEVSEVNDGKAGYTYDGKTYKVKVKATYSAETNTYSYTLEKGTTEGVTISGGKISLPDKSFQNSFKAASGSLSLEGSKSLTGTELKDNMFEFRLSGDAEKTVKNAGTKVDFGTIASWTGTDAKEFTFEVSEVNDGKAGYTYDGKTYKVKVKATYSAETNTYSYTLEKGTTEGVTISGGKISLPDKSFQNSFEAASGSLSLEGSKSLTGTELKDNMFEFRLSGDAEKTVKNAGTKVDFGTIASWTGTDAKEFTFEVSEVNDGKAGYTYDGKTYKVKVKATYSAETNTYSYTLEKGTTEGVTISGGKISLPDKSFQNSFEAASGSLSLEGSKSLTGTELKDNMFEFRLSGDAEKTVKNAGTKVDFGTIASWTGTDAKEFTFEVSEVNDGKAGYTYDGKTYKVKVKATYSAETNTYSYTLEKGTTEGVTISGGKISLPDKSFQNSFKAASGSLSLEGSKSLTGTELKDNMFEFRLSGDAEKTVKNAGTKVDFGTIASWTGTDAKEFTFEVSEVNDGKAGYTYDGKTYKVKVKATYSAETNTYSYTLEKGTTEGVTISGGKISLPDKSFQNSFKAASGSLSLEGSKSLTGTELKDNMFEFRLSGDAEKTVKNAGTKVDFGTIASWTGTDAKEFTFEVSEVNDGKAGYTYDGKTYKVKVKATYSAETNTYSYTLEKGTTEGVTISGGKISLPDKSFQNSFEAASGSLSLEGSKSLTGTELKDNMFEFRLSGDAEKTVKNAGTKVDFGTIASWTGTDAKEFTFEVSEVNDGKAGYTYDGKTYKVKVKATYSAETNTYSYTLEKGTTEGVTISGGKISLPDKSFQNSFEAASGSLSLEGSKSLTGTELKDNMFEFRLSGDAEKTVKNAGTKVDFGTIASWTGTDAKEFTFEVSEVNDGKAGYTYDGKTYKVKVKATYSAETNTYSYTLEKGTTEGVTISGGKISLPDKSFQNSFEAASGSLSLEGSKSLTGTELKDNMFEFRLSGDAEKTVKNAGTKVDFGTIASWTGTDAKEFTFEVSEVNDGKAGYTYDGKTYKVKVKATYSAETNTYSYTLEKGTTEGVTISGGKISLPDKSFQNSFEAASGSLSLEGSKSLTGTELKDNMFEFRLSGDAEKTVKNAGTKVDFGTIASWTGTDAKEFTFEVSEVNDGKAGYTYDGKTYKVKVKATYSAETNTYSYTLEKGTTEGVTISGGKISLPDKSFQNSFEAASGSLSLEGSKSLTGTELKDNMFEFRLSGDAEKTVKNAGTKVDFGTIASWTGTDAKEFTFEVSEVNDGKAGYTYDGKTYKVKVKATYSAETNTYSYTLEKGTTEGVTISGGKISLPDKSFQNSFEAASGSLSLEGSKSLTGTELKDNMFEFRLSGDAEKTVKNAGTKVDFGTIASWTGTDAKEFTFEVSEVNDGKAGYTYDGKTYKVKVKATYSAETNTYSYTLEKGTTEGVTISGGKISLPDKSFQNSFEAASGSLSLEGSKSLTGTELKDNMFEFRLSGDAEKTVKNAGTKVDFGTIASWTGTDAKEFTFEVSEVNDGKAGYTYDGKTYKVKVKATYSAETNTYSYTLEKGTTEGVTISGGKISLPDKSFQNSFEAASGSLSLEGSKSLTGTELKDNMFEFRLSGDAEKTVKNAGTKVDFGTIASWTGTDAKEFTFEVSEVNDGKAGYTYDGKTYKVKVKATYSAETNTYSYSIMNGTTEGVTISKIGVISLPNASFVNEYNATGETTLTATKTLSGREFQAGDNWKFTVTCNDANAPLPENPVVTTTATSGTSTTLDFGKIHYTIADVNKDYVYTITESGNVANVTNDPVAARTVTVSVRDKGDGTLNVTQEVTGAGLTFTNKYVDGETNLGVTKVLSGREFKSGDEWTFKLTADEGTPMPAQTVVKTNATSGYTQSLSFGTIKYTLADVGNTYTYTIQETGSAEGVTNDPNATRTVTITVNEGKDGKLDIVREEPKGEIVFTNTYDAKGSLTLKASKTLKNKALEADAFNFVLKDENGETIQTVANDADGNVTFSPLNYTLKDVGTHVYTVSEVQRENTEVTYDTTEYTVEVTVADVGNGKLKVSKTIKKGDDTVDAIAFENIYKGVIDISGSKTWNDADNQDGIRPTSITVKLFANGTEAASQVVTPDEAGNWNYVFKNLPQYDVNGEITYTVTEDAVAGYETSVSGYNITNTHKSATIDITGHKTWNDNNNQDGKRPKSITVNLLANGRITDTKTVTADDNWTYSFENLPKYEAGKEIVYTVTEDAVADYTTEITGYDITNSYAPGKTSVTVTKAWADNDDRGGHRPKEIKVQLKADGENSGEEITLNAENKWTYTWSELDEKKAGKDIVYTVEEIGKTAGYISTVTGNVTEGFIITNTITSVKISKVDITDQKELAGAHIQILDKDGNVVDEWDSTWESHEVTGLKTGEKYTLRETVAPDGYTITADTVFSLKEDGTLDKDNTSTTISADGTLLVEDSRTSVKVSKVDISDGEELEGAHIQIIDQDGNVVDEWDSTKEAHVIEKLKTGKTYTLRETVAPDGYLLTSDTTFVLKEDGTVDAEKTTAVSKDGVLLVQDKLATSASIAVTKKLTYIGESLAAKDQTFYVALYSDKECTQRVSDVKALVFKNADASTVVFSENIKAGKTYYIAECTQDGTAQTIGALADGTVYEAVFGNGNSTTVTEVNGTTTVSFENVFSSFPPDGFYKQGQLTITKKVLGADGGTRNSNEVFYAGIFDDAAHTQLSQQVEQNIIKLDMDGGYEVSETINVGLAQSGAKVTLYVTETDSNGKPIAGSEGFGYKVTVSADSVTLDETNMTAEVVITNQEESTVTETPTPTPSSDGGNSGGSENHSGGYGGGKSPKTGDDTPIGTYLMLLLAAAMLAAETERRRRRNKRQ